MRSCIPIASGEIAKWKQVVEKRTDVGGSRVAFERSLSTTHDSSSREVDIRKTSALIAYERYKLH
jgi:hypothetical protein